MKDNLYLVTGGGSTAGFVTGTGVVLVDTKYPDWGPAIMDKVKSVTDKAVTHIIDTSGFRSSPLRSRSRPSPTGPTPTR